MNKIKIKKYKKIIPGCGEWQDQRSSLVLPRTAQEEGGRVGDARTSAQSGLAASWRIWLMRAKGERTNLIGDHAVRRRHGRDAISNVN